MENTIIWLIFLSELLFWCGVGIIGIYLWKNTRKIENEANGPTFQEIIDHFSERIEKISKNVPKLVKKELMSQEVQDQLMQTSMSGVATLFNDEKTQKIISEFISENVAIAAQSTLSEMFQGGIPNLPISDEEIKRLDQKTDRALGAISVNAISTMLPPGAGLLLNQIFPDWKEQAQTNPKEFIWLIQKAQQMGLFNMAQGVMGTTGQALPTKSVSKGW